MITEAGVCRWVMEAMTREVRPQRDMNGGFWRSIELTGEMWFWCQTHGVEEYGPKAEVLDAAGRHCPDIAARLG
jgi:hypothetical protein